METNVIVFPDFQKLKDRVDALRTELSTVMLENSFLAKLFLRRRRAPG